MRTTLDIDDDVLQAAKERARCERRTIGEVISDLARSALAAPPSTPIHGSTSLYGFRPFPRRGAVVTNELIDKLRDEDAY